MHCSLVKFSSHEKTSPNSEQPPVGEDKVKIYAVTYGRVLRTYSIGVEKTLPFSVLKSREKQCFFILPIYSLSKCDKRYWTVSPKVVFVTNTQDHTYQALNSLVVEYPPSLFLLLQRIRRLGRSSISDQSYCIILAGFPII